MVQSQEVADLVHRHTVEVVRPGCRAFADHRVPERVLKGVFVRKSDSGESQNVVAGPLSENQVADLAVLIEDDEVLPAATINNFGEVGTIDVLVQKPGLGILNPEG